MQKELFYLYQQKYKLKVIGWDWKLVRQTVTKCFMSKQQRSKKSILT